MKKLSILMLHLKYGGVEKQTITMANALCDKYDIEIISLYNFNNIIAYDLDSKINVKYLLPYGSNKAEFKQAVKEKNIIHTFKEALKAVKVLYNKNRAIKSYIKKADSDIIFSTRIEFTNLLSKYNKRNILTVTQEHNHIDTEKYGKKVRKSFKNIDTLVVMTDTAKKIYSKWLNGLNIKIKIIPNILEKVSSETTNLNNNKIIAVGRLHPVKNYSALIDVFSLANKKNEEIKLTICGSGEEEELLKEKVNILGLNHNVEFTGMISAKEVEEKMLKSDLFVMTSISECFPMVLLEANACGVPIISFDVETGPRAIIVDGKNGFLIENNNLKKMANKILEYMENKEMKEKMSEFSKEYSKQFLAINIVQKWIDIFERS